MGRTIGEGSPPPLTLRIAVVGVASTVTASAAAVGGVWAWTAGVAAWTLVLLIVVLVRRPARGFLAWLGMAAVVAVTAGVPLVAVLGVLAARRAGDRGAAPLLVGGAAVVVLAAGCEAILLLRRSTRRSLLAVAVLACALPVLVVPVATDALLERGITRRIDRCPAMAAFAGRQASRWQRRELADGCDTSRTPADVRQVGDLRLDVFKAGRAVADDAGAALAHHEALLGPPSILTTQVLPVALAGNVRGKAGPGYVLVDEDELADPRDCSAFRASAGVRGRCGSWVVAHELGHQWFKWTAFTDVGTGWPVVLEGTSDYLAFDWWRATFGAADAQRLATELFDARMALARSFAAEHPPGLPLPFLTDAQSRAVAYGRASAAWVALERAVGVDTTHTILRLVFDVGRQPHPTLEKVLAAVAVASLEGQELLRRWWLDPTFEPRLAPA
jgi:hypothetical protein